MEAVIRNVLTVMNTVTGPVTVPKKEIRESVIIVANLDISPSSVLIKTAVVLVVAQDPCQDLHQDQDREAVLVLAPEDVLAMVVAVGVGVGVEVKVIAALAIVIMIEKMDLRKTHHLRLLLLLLLPQAQQLHLHHLPLPPLLLQSQPRNWAILVVCFLCSCYFYCVVVVVLLLDIHFCCSTHCRIVYRSLSLLSF